MNLSNWHTPSSDAPRNKRLLVGYAAGTGVFAILALLASQATGQRVEPPKDDAIDVTLVTSPEPPAPMPEPEVKAAPANEPDPSPAPVRPGPPPITAPTAVPTDAPKEQDSTGSTSGQQDPYEGGSNGSGSGTGPASTHTTEAKPAARVVQRRPTPVSLPEDATPPVPVVKSQPAYPPDAKAQGIETVVVVRYVVTESGAVSDARVVRGHPLFNDACLVAVKSWRFQPAMYHGQAIPVVRMVRFPFKLQP